MVDMPIVEGTIVITASAADVFALSQDYALRHSWDPFVREMRSLDGALEPGVGVRVWVRAWTGLSMEVIFTSFRPPTAVAMKMRRGPTIFSRFAGVWLFKALPDGSTEVTFRYAFAVRGFWLRPLLTPIIRWIFQRDVLARLRGLKRGAESRFNSTQRQQV